METEKEMGGGGGGGARDRRGERGGDVMSS